MKNCKILFVLLISTYIEDRRFETSNKQIPIDTSTWVKGQKYALHVKGAENTEILVVEW